MTHYENFSLPLHSTGTCLANGIKRFFNLYCDHAIKLDQAEVTLYPEQLDYYLEFARRTSFKKLGLELKPYLAVVTDGGPQEVCVDTGDPFNAETEEENHCPFPCPCSKRNTSCYTLSPSCRLLQMPSRKLLYIHILRHPLDIVVDVYDRFFGDRKGEEITGDATMNPMVSYLTHMGANRSELESLGAMDKEVEKMTYSSFIRSRREIDGLRLEFMRTGPDLWRMARLHKR
jgi:hypothetical protein